MNWAKTEYGTDWQFAYSQMLRRANKSQVTGVWQLMAQKIKSLWAKLNQSPFEKQLANAERHLRS
jgi:hypothetical protein